MSVIIAEVPIITMLVMVLANMSIVIHTMEVVWTKDTNITSAGVAVIQIMNILGTVRVIMNMHTITKAIVKMKVMTIMSAPNV
jgi:hypothetical protein